jgi:iron complex outermembrane receptor protein
MSKNRRFAGISWCTRWLGCAALLLAQSAFAQDQNAVVAGVVRTRPEGQPIANAVVSVDGSGLSTTTNPVGRFRLERVPTGRITLIVQAPGFLEQRVSDVQAQANAVAQVTVDLEPTPNFLERVQVTATKEPLSIGDVAAQTDVIDRSLIERRGDQSLTQAIAHVPGAVVSTQLGIFESVMLRGTPRGDPEFTNTLLLIDGVPQTTSRNASRVVGLTINDANSIEIVRGPNTALYGRTAIGGSVNVLTANPTPSPEFAVDFTGGQQGLAKGIATVSGPIKERAGYYASIARERSSGFYNTKTGGDFVVGNTAVFGKLTFVPDNKSFGSVSFNYVDSDNSTPTNEPIIDGQLLHVLDPRFDRLTNFNVPGPNYHQGEGRLTVNYTRQLAPWAKLVEVFGYRSVRHQFINDGDFIGSPFDLASATIEQYPFDQDLKEKIAYQELRVEFLPRVGRTKNSLIVGASYERNSGTLATDFLFTDPENEGIPVNYLNPVIPPLSTWSHDVQPTRTYHVGITGLFAQYLIEPGSRWVFGAGGRYDRLALDNTPEGGSKLEDTFSAFSPKANATYRLIVPDSSGQRPTVNLYAAYSRAFLPPRAPSSLTPANVVLNLQPEHIDNVEGGLKSTLLNGRVSLEGTYFWMREDGVVLTRRQGPFFFPTNAGEQRYKGVETGVGVTVSRKVSAYLNASFYRNRFGDFVIQSEDGDEPLTGNRLPISPNYVVNWGVTVTPAGNIDARLNVKHLSAVLADRANTFTIDPYTLVDAAVTWRRGPLRVTLAGRNLFNQEYYWNADGETADPGRPRQILVTTSVKFR